MKWWKTVAGLHIMITIWERTRAERDALSAMASDLQVMEEENQKKLAWGEVVKGSCRIAHYDMGWERTQVERGALSVMASDLQVMEEGKKKGEKKPNKQKLM